MFDLSGHSTTVYFGIHHPLQFFENRKAKTTYFDFLKENKKKWKVR